MLGSFPPELRGRLAATSLLRSREPTLSCNHTIPPGLKPNPNYFFWSGNGLPKTFVANWQRPCRRLFKVANLRKPDGTPKRCHCHMFRDTFAVEMLLAGVPMRRPCVSRHKDEQVAARWKTRSPDCRKHLRWTHDGVHYRRTAGTGSWTEAEQVKRNLEDQLAGRTSSPSPEDNTQTIAGAVPRLSPTKRSKG
jgi:hypothetical protein